MTKSSANTEFLNVDLDLRAKRGLGILLQGLEPFAFVLHQTDKQASLELNGKSRPSLERTILGLIKAVQSLPPEAATIWKNCDYRIFNVGVQAGREPYSTEFSISKKAVSLLADTGAEIVLTVYAPLEEEAAGDMPSSGRPLTGRPRPKKAGNRPQIGLGKPPERL